MKQFVANKKERIEMGKIIELRGNFIEHETEDGIQYECEYYRTTDKTATFEQMYKAEKVKEAKKYLTSTDWIYAKCVEEGLNASVVYSDVVAKRKEAREYISENS